MFSVHDHETLPGEKIEVHMEDVNHTTYLYVFSLQEFFFFFIMF